MAFLRKVFSSVVAKLQFPEYNDLLASIQTLRAVASTVIESDMAGFGKEFECFANSQPPAIKAQLLAIKTAGDEQSEAMRVLWTECGSLPADLDCLRAKNQEFQARQRELEAARELAKASRSTAVKTQDALDRAERKGNQLEVKKLVDSLEQAKKKADDDEAAASAAEDRWKEYELAYPAQFADLVSATLAPVIDRKIHELQRLTALADDIVDAAGKFEYFDDPSNANFKARIQELEAFVIE
jgi:hypothetical protein